MSSSDPPQFGDAEVPLELLRERAFNLRWAMQPEDVIPLTAADVDFPCAPVIREAIADYALSGVFSYGPPEGLPEFRRACADMLQARHDTNAEPEHCLAVNSAAKGMSIVANTVLGPGDEAIIFDPVDFLFAHTLEAAGATVVRVPIDPSTGELDLEAVRAAVTPRTRMIALCNPHNPVGASFTRTELEGVAGIALENDLWLMSDEIWSEIVFGPTPHVATASLSAEVAARTFTVHGLSKTFGMAGLRIGFVHIADEEAFARLLETSDVRSTVEGVSTLSQVGATAAYEHGWPWADAFVNHLRSNRDLALDRLRTVDGLKVRTPQACSVLFPDVSAWGDESALQERLLEEHRVAVVPGAPRWFGPGAAGHLRLTFATSETILRAGVDRLIEGLHALR